MSSLLILFLGLLIPFGILCLASAIMLGHPSDR